LQIVGPQYNDTILDWSSRATHVSKILGQEVVDMFYGPAAGVRVSEESSKSKQKKRNRTYFAGCSVGGKVREKSL